MPPFSGGHFRIVIRKRTLKVRTRSILFRIARRFQRNKVRIFILKKNLFFSLVLRKIRQVSLPFVVDGSDMAIWRISTGRRDHLLYYSAPTTEIKKILEIFLKIGNVKVIRQRLVSRVSTEQDKRSGMAVRVFIACKITFSTSQGCRSRKKMASIFFYFQTF